MARGQLSGIQRLLFVIALFTFGLSSIYTSVAMLTRITPALFPGKDFTNLPGLGDIAKNVGIAPAPAGGVFNKRINLLIMGVDQRPGAAAAPDLVKYEGRTDTLMIATLDPVGKTVSFLSFPRDMVIETARPGMQPYKDRINASFINGLEQGKSIEAGAKQLEDDIKRNFGIEIDNYVLMDFKGVEKLVNAVDGVDIDIPPELGVYDWWYSDEDPSGAPPHYVTYPAGLQHLDGYNAVAFGRNRDPSDFARVKRQQLVLQGVLSKAFSLGLLDPTSWPGLWDAYSTTVRTDLPKTRMVGLAPLLKDIIGKSRTFSVADPVDGRESVWPCTLGDASVVCWDASNVQYWLAQVFTKASYSGATVEIQNGYGGDGTARAASLGRYLKYSKGLPTVYYGPDQDAQPETTMILYDSTKQELADDISTWLGIPAQNVTIRDKAGDATLPDVVVIIGHNYKVPGG